MPLSDFFSGPRFHERQDVISNSSAYANDGIHLRTISLKKENNSTCTPTECNTTIGFQSEILDEYARTRYLDHRNYIDTSN